MPVAHIEWGDYDPDFAYQANIEQDYSYLRFNNVDELDRVIKKLNTNFENTLSRQQARDKKINSKFEELKEDVNKRFADTNDILTIIKDAYNLFVDDYNNSMQQIANDIRSLKQMVSALESTSSGN